MCFMYTKIERRVITTWVKIDKGTLSFLTSSFMQNYLQACIKEGSNLTVSLAKNIQGTLTISAKEKPGGGFS